MDYIKDLDNQGLLQRNFDHPPLKDTVTVPVGGYTIIRFIADNPGTWLFHCHLEFHSEIGMMVMFKVGKTSDIKNKPVGFPKCGAFSFKGLEITSKSAQNLQFNSVFYLIISIVYLVL